MGDSSPVKQVTKLDLSDGQEVTSKDEALEALQEQLSKEQDARREERFIWLVCLILVFDALEFQRMTTWSGPFILGLIQLLFIVAMGRKWGVDHIWTITEKLIDRWDGRLRP